MRNVVFVVMACWLGACAGRDPLVYSEWNKTSGNWTIDATVDRVTGAPIASAILTTQAASNSGVPQPGNAMLQLTCFEKIPIVRLSFDFKIGTDKNSILGYRFDDKPGRDNVNSRILPGYTVLVIEDPAEVARFVADLANANTLVVRIRSLNAGRTVADFKLERAGPAVEAGFAGCPVVAPAPVVAAKPRRRAGT